MVEVDEEETFPVQMKVGFISCTVLSPEHARQGVYVLIIYTPSISIFSMHLHYTPFLYIYDARTGLCNTCRRLQPCPEVTLLCLYRHPAASDEYHVGASSMRARYCLHVGRWA